MYTPSKILAIFALEPAGNIGAKKELTTTHLSPSQEEEELLMIEGKWEESRVFSC